LLKTALLDDMPEVQGGLWKSRPLTDVIPPSVDAPPPRQGHFLGVFLPLRGAVGGAAREDLDKVDGDSKAFEKALDSRLQSAKDRHGSWALYSKACFETIARSADLLRNDLGTAIEPLRQTKTRLDAEDWVSRAKEECETKASDKTCKAPPNFATAKDKEACEQTCSGAIAAAVDKSYRDAVASCAESFRSSGGTAQASCEFDVPEDATFRMDDYGRRCTQACTLAGKQAIYDDEQRLEAKKQGGSLLFLYNSCMRTAKRSPLVTQWENGNPQKYQHALKREERRCRFDAKCSWLEKYSDRVCKPADAPPT
jgi:hypothetical protein